MRTGALLWWTRVSRDESAETADRYFEALQTKITDDRSVLGKLVAITKRRVISSNPR